MDDLKIAKKYTTKAGNAAASGHEFDMSFTEFKRLMLTKRCKYTGMVMTEQEGPNPKSTDRTLDRYDNAEGYVHGNVYAVCHWVNQLKSTLEDPKNKISAEHVSNVGRFLTKRGFNPCK